MNNISNIKKLEDIVLQNNFIIDKPEKKWTKNRHTNIIYCHNSSCGDQAVCYFNKDKRCYKINGCFISRYSIYLLFSEWNNKKLWTEIQKIINLSLEVDLSHILFILKKINIIEDRIIKIFNNNPYRINCFLFVWGHIIEYKNKIKKNNQYIGKYEQKKQDDRILKKI